MTSGSSGHGFQSTTASLRIITTTALETLADRQRHWSINTRHPRRKRPFSAVPGYVAAQQNRSARNPGDPSMSP
ncbi:hypothetical protein I547_5645 [Mycobacterium kansasii 824]|uniref:Uncharacterized protein n=1 Tax=Mycobacterium kansasii TaxID=1768 RepID=A0A1V3XCJ1_MYCKA|nr:hypothetical protein I547_5645 [Mycobacterium kansasii 824]OOK76818.1 hypothetical protein BZL29_3912 [Mycobacterium kansasii]